MDAKTLFQQAVKQAEPCILHIHDDQLGGSTPCSEWDLKALVNHIVYEVSWVPDLLQGKTVAEVGARYDGDLLGDDPVGAWRSAIKKAQDAVNLADINTTVHLSYGDVTAEHYIKEVASDIAIHGWDVAQSTKCNMLFPEELSQAIYAFNEPRKEEMAASGQFGQPVSVSATEPTQTRLLALFGRKANTVS